MSKKTTEEIMADMEIPSIECHEMQKIADVFVLLMTKQKQHANEYGKQLALLEIDLFNDEGEFCLMFRRYLSFHDALAADLLKYVMVTEVKCPHTKKHDRMHFLRLMAL